MEPIECELCQENEPYATWSIDHPNGYVEFPLCDDCTGKILVVMTQGWRQAIERRNAEVEALMQNLFGTSVKGLFK